MIVPSGSSVISCPFSALQHAVPLARAALVFVAALRMLLFRLQVLTLVLLKLSQSGWVT